MKITSIVVMVAAVLAVTFAGCISTPEKETSGHSDPSPFPSQNHKPEQNMQSWEMS